MTQRKPCNNMLTTIVRTAAVLALAIACLPGCGRNPYGTNSYWGAPYASQYPGGAPAVGMPGAAYPQQAQVAELERRIQQLDMDNRQLTTQLAQSQQKWQVSDERANLFQRQLQDATAQLQQARLAQQDLQGQTRGLQATMSMRGGATIRPNTSYAQPSVPGLVGSPQAPGAIQPGALQPGALQPNAPSPVGNLPGSFPGAMQSPSASTNNNSLGSWPVQPCQAYKFPEPSFKRKGKLYAFAFKRISYSRPDQTS